MITKDELGWVAGIIDVKGHIVKKNNQTRNTPQVVLYVETKILPIIQRLNELTGTKSDLKAERPIREFMRKRCSQHCPGNHIHITEQDLSMPSVARWTITGAGLAIILQNVLPFLVDKRNYPELVVDVIEQTKMSGRGSTAALVSIRRLANLGWKLPKEFTSAMD